MIVSWKKSISEEELDARINLMMRCDPDEFVVFGGRLPENLRALITETGHRLHETPVDMTDMRVYALNFKHWKPSMYEWLMRLEDKNPGGNRAPRNKPAKRHQENRMVAFQITDHS